VTVRVVLVGLPGVGKSSVGAALASELEVAFVDLDDVVASRCGAPPAALLRRHGERAFRSLEAEALAAALAGKHDAVLATGGGTVESATARALLADEPLVVQLVAPSTCLLGRLGDVDRPLLEAPTIDALDALAARRGAWYDEVADARVDASGPIDDVVDAVARLVVRT
jgi:shikimate kinase